MISEFKINERLGAQIADDEYAKDKSVIGAKANEMAFVFQDKSCAALCLKILNKLQKNYRQDYYAEILHRDAETAVV